MGLGMEIFLSVKINMYTILQITMLQQISLALLQYEHRRRSNHEIKRPVLISASEFLKYVFFGEALFKTSRNSILSY